MALQAEADGYISKIDAYEIGMTAIDIGAGRRKKEDTIDHSAGFEFSKKVGEKVKKGDTILTIHTNNADSLEDAKTRLTRAIVITKEKPVERKTIFYVVDKDGMREFASGGSAR